MEDQLFIMQYPKFIIFGVETPTLIHYMKSIRVKVIVFESSESR